MFNRCSRCIHLWAVIASEVNRGQLEFCKEHLAAGVYHFGVWFIVLIYGWGFVKLPS
ncbi:MAG: hypothetical protein QW680_14125 [Pyrobaculum sp.]